MTVIRDVRDVAIIILALVSIGIGVLLAMLIVQLQRLTRMLRTEIKPILESTNETVSTVRGTTSFMSKHLVSPVMDVASFFSGLRRVAQVVTGWPKSSGEAGTSTIGDAMPSSETAHSGSNSEPSQ